MTELEFAQLGDRVLGAAFALAVAFGALMQRTHFCSMGAVADVVHMGDWTRARMWALALGVAVIGFNAMVAAGWVESRHAVQAGPRLLWLSTAVGGSLFGVGMVLASGCGAKTLVRLGGGNLKSLVVLLVLAVSAYATLRGITAVPRSAWLDRAAIELPGGQDLPSLLGHAIGLPRRALALGLGLALGAVLLAFALMRPEGRSAESLAGGLGIGLVVVALWWVSGALGHVAEHPLTLEETFVATRSRGMESFSFVAPTADALDWLILFSDRSRGLTLGVVSVAGMVLGGAASAWATGSFRWESFSSTEDMANHLVGGLLMGVGGVTALGCTVGQGLSGASTLSIGSFIAVGGIITGALAALRWQAWRVERSL